MTSSWLKGEVQDFSTWWLLGKYSMGQLKLAEICGGGLSRTIDYILASKLLSGWRYFWHKVVSYWTSPLIRAQETGP